MKNEISPVLSDPEIATYDISELVIDTEYVATGASSIKSSRRYKTSFRRVDARRVLRHVMSAF